MISIKTNNRLVITILDNTITIDNADNIRADLKKTVAENSNQDIFIDLVNVNFLDSSGIAMFVNFVHSLTGARRKMSLINAAPLIRNTIKVLNLTKFLNVQ
jgi:anti-anti-sigma factor